MNGGDEDGVLSATDTIFSSLALWIDADHDGVSQADEIRSLADYGIEGIDLDYRESARTDRHGNEFRYRSKILLERGGTRPAWDVFLVTE